MCVCCLLTVLLVLFGGCSASAPSSKPSAQTTSAASSKQRVRDLIDQGQYAQAVDILVPLKGKLKNDPQVYTMLAESYWKLGLYNDAVSNFEAALRLDYSDADAHRDFGQMLMEMGKVGRALTEFELAIRSGDRNALSYYNYGLALYEFGRRDAALAQWQIAFSAEPQNAKYAEALGIGLTGKNDVEALGYFETAAELGANGASFHNNFGLLLLRLKRFSDAENHFAMAVEIDPQNESYRFNLVVSRLRSKRYAAAIPVLEALVTGAPDNATYRVYLGRSYYEAGRHQDVVALLEPWLSSDTVPHKSDGGPDLGGAYDALAMSLRALEQPEKAGVFSASAIEWDPSNPAYLNNYGVILAENGRIEEARAQWEKVLQIEPDNEVAKQNLSAVRK